MITTIKKKNYSIENLIKPYWLNVVYVLQTHRYHSKFNTICVTQNLSLDSAGKTIVLTSQKYNVPIHFYLTIHVYFKFLCTFNVILTGIVIIH